MEPNTDKYLLLLNALDDEKVSVVWNLSGMECVPRTRKVRRQGK